MLTRNLQKISTKLSNIHQENCLVIDIKYFGSGMEGINGVIPKRFQNCNAEKVKYISRTKKKNFVEIFLNGFGQKLISHTIFKKIVENIFTSFSLLCFDITPIIYLLWLEYNVESFKMMSKKIILKFC